MDDWVDDLQEEIAKLKAQKKRLQAKNKKLREENKRLKETQSPTVPFEPVLYPWWHPNYPYTTTSFDGSFSTASQNRMRG